MTFHVKHWSASLTIILALAASPAIGAPKKAHSGPQVASHCVYTNDGRQICKSVRGVQKSNSHHFSAKRMPVNDPRPGRWCAWWLRRYLGIPRSSFRAYEWNLARGFEHVGLRASGPAIGVVVIWQHHVGIIVGKSGNGEWIIKSGNDGHRVRERPRSLKGVIAYRWVNQISFNR